MARPVARTRIKKRIFVVGGIALTVIALAAGLLSWLLASLIGPANLYRFQIDQQNDQPAVLGSGVNLEQAVSANFVRDSSFEPLIFKNALTLYGGDEDTLTVSSEEASAGLYGDGFFNGASARIMTMTPGGLSLKKIAKVTHYGINRVGVFQTLTLPADVPRNRALLDFVRHSQQSVAVGQGGLVIRNVAGQTVLSGSSGVTSDLIGVCALSGGFLAVSTAGDVIHSVDGAAWKPWTAISPASFTAIAASDQDLAVAVGMDGQILTGSNGYLNPVISGTEKNLRTIAYGLSTFIAAGDDGAILRSTNGLVWETLLSATDTDWHSVIYQDGRFLIVGSRGQIGLSDDGRTFSFLTVDSALAYVDAAMLSSQQLILLDSQGRFYISNDSGKSWQRSGIDTGMVSHRIELIGNDKILSADNAGHLGQAQIVAEIDLDSPLQGQAYQPGDLCFLEIGKNQIPGNYLGDEAERARTTDPWQVQGSGSAERTSDEAAPSGGTSSMRVSAGLKTPAEASDTTILTQLINPGLIQSKPKNQVYRIDLFMRQDQISNRSVMTWVSGPFASVGTEFTNVGSAYKKYTFTFVLPNNVVTEQSEVRLNISFSGPGTLLIDRIYFGPATDPYSGMDKSFAESVLAASPSVIRLAFTGLGNAHTASDAFARIIDSTNPSLNEEGLRNGTVLSAATALNLCIKANAAPYLVIGPYMSEADMQNFLEYLCGPISETFGQLRMNSGMIAPYTNAFTRILIEVADQEGILHSDEQKSAYVNLLIRTIEQSPYYRQVKSKLIFVDGMDYQDGVLLSRADYHASDFEALLNGEPVSDIDEAYLDYFDLIPRTPDRPENLSSELMRSVRITTASGQKMRMADLTSILLRDLGDFTSLTCLNLDPDLSGINRQIHLSAANVASMAARGSALSVSLMTESSTGTTSTDSGGLKPAGNQKSQPVHAYAYMNDQMIRVVLVNSGTTPAMLQLSTILPVTPGSIRKYDENGQLLSTQKFRRPNGRINLMPGGVAFIESDQSVQVAK